MTTAAIRRAQTGLHALNIKTTFELDRYITDNPTIHAGMPQFMTRLEALAEIAGPEAAEPLLSILPEWL